jgi:SAM-dependent methyltransferase
MTDPNPASQLESYTWRNTNVAKEIHGARTAASVGGFFMPLLRPGMRLLDCGCGPGSITVGLAELLAPGKVIGIDANPDLIATAQTAAQEAGLANVTFQTGDVYRLTFNDNSFDAVWVHALLEHLSDPLAALAEMQRVLKPGGIIGVRELGLDSMIIGPESPALTRVFDLWIRLTRENGGDTQIGKKLPNLLNVAGFTDVCFSATIEQHGRAMLQPFVPVEVSVANLTALLGPFQTRGYATPAEIAELRQALHDWGQHPEGIGAFARCEAIARKKST